MGFAMHVGVLPLLGSLAVGGPPALPAAPPTPAIVRASGTATGGILPTPGQGAPGAVAAFGAIMVGGPQPPAALPAPAPLVAAKFLTPQGVRVTAFPGSGLSRMFDAPTVLGLRPGFVYRFELTNLPYNPGKALYPEVEVRGVLVPRPGMKYMDYPLPLVFSLADIERALSGAMVTKVIYMEDPEKAVPSLAPADFPIEVSEDTEKAALRAANENGRLMAIVRLGDRKPSPQYLQSVAVDGTILLPGEKYLRSPVVPPVFPFWGCPLYDPILGPKGPKEECFVNGDDKRAPLGIGPNDQLGGLDPTDVGVEFTIGGRRKVTTSCLACICSPRYVIRRVELLPNGFEVRNALAGQTALAGPMVFKDRSAPMLDIAREKANQFIGRVRPMAYVGRIGTAFFIGTTQPVVIGQVEGVKVTGALVEPEVFTGIPTCCPLTVTKSVDPPGPKQPGDVVTVTIRYANTSGKAISDIVVSDSLSPRLEYLPGSAQTDRPANFSAAENEVGSALLRWELPGEIFPGQAGTIKFKARVR